MAMCAMRGKMNIRCLFQVVWYKNVESNLTVHMYKFPWSLRVVDS